MSLSNDLISQFVELTKQDTQVQNGSTVYGTVKKQNGQDYVQIDGSELMTPVKSTTYVSDGERVTVMIKDHQAIITGNITSPATRQNDVENTVGDKIAEYDVVVAEQIQAEYAKLETVIADNITAVNAEIENLVSENIEVKGTLTAQKGEIDDLKVKKLDAETANLTFATIDELKATNIEVNKISGNFAEFAAVTTDQLTAQDADIKKLKTDKLDASQAEIKYANIDFANIGMAAIEELFTKSGIIQNLVVGDQHITGELVGVTIKGDLIEGNTIVADKLVVKGSDGLYYKLNTNGMKVEAEQTEYNSLNGSIITAKSITASKVMVDDLVAFDATIGGFKITDNSIYSGVKSSVDNTTKGIYLDNTGQVAFGNSNNFIKFFKDSDGQWKLAISANSVTLSTSNKNVEDVIDDINGKVQSTVKLVETYYAMNDSYSTAPTTGWSTTSPTWVNGKYIWSKTKTTYIDGSSTESNPACITGAKGESGTSGSAGKGIKNITNYYLATSTNSGITISTSGWTTTMQSMSSTKKYLWNYEMITYTDDSTTKTNPVIIGVYGDKGQNGAAGEDGVGILSITDKYAVSSSNTTAPTVWYDAVQTMTSSNRYLWNYEIVKYTNNTTSETAKRVIGVYGDKGEAGVGITSVDVEYYLSTSSTAQSGGSWSTTAPTWVDGKYMWSRTKTVTTAGKTTYSNPVCITGGKGNTGATGATGKGVSSITEEYYLSTSKTTQSGGSWVTTPPTWSSGKYMWTRSKIVYTNPASTVYTAPVCDSSWEAVNEVETRISTAEQKITPTAILQAVNTQIGAGGQINTVSTILDKTGFTVKNGAIKVQNKAGQNVLVGDSNGNLKMSGSVVVNTQNSQQLFVKTNDDKHPVLVGQSKGVFCSNLAVSDNYVDWSSDRAWSGTSISPTGISTGSLNTSGSTSINGSLTYKGHTILNGSDMWLRTYGESGWYNETYGGGWFMADSSWLRAYGDKGIYSGGSIETGSNMRCGDVLYFTRSETGYWLKARWLYNRCSIEAPNFTGNGLLSDNKIYLRSNSPYGGMILDTGGYFYPEQNNGVSIGHPNGYRISTLYYTNLSAASDLKLKENISYINTSDNQTMSVDEVINTKDFYTFVKDELRLATFDYKTVDKDEQSNRGKIGFIAQDISETKVGKHILKADEIKQIDLVDVDKMILDEGETVLSYDLTDYVNVLAGALQEATKKIDLLENENMELKERLSKLENLVNQIISK